MRTNGTWVPQFFSDLERVLARNGRPAYALLVNRQAKVLTQLAYAGYPCFNMISRDFDFQASDLVRSVYWPQNFGASSEYTAAIYSLATTEGGGDFEDGQGIEVELDGDDQLALVNNFPETRSPTYPDRAKLITLATHSGRDSQPSELLITSVTANGPFVHALLFAQCPQSFELNDDDLSSTAVVGASEIHAKGEIVGFRSLSAETLQQFQIIYENTFRNMRPQYGWSAVDGVYVDFTTSKTNLRYIFDQTVGQGGTACADDGPAITLPLMYSAAGRRNQVRAYVFVYAAMSGATNTGSIGVANKDDNGDMATAPTAITNGPTITGTTFAWYPTLASWDEDTSPYFMAYAGSTFDRVVLAAKSSGSTDSVRIGAFAFVVRPETS